MTLSYQIAPSILSANFAKLGEEVRAVLAAGADIIHFDVMDNHYVPNLTIGPLICESLRKDGINAPIDVHLMVKPVDSMIEAFIKAGANTISFHPEASEHIDRSLQLIRDGGCQAGLAFNPAAPMDCLDYVLDKLDFVLIMSVNPGFSGQKFIPGSIKKIELCKARLNAADHPIRIAVDGGINQETIKLVAQAGADTFIAGSAIFNTDDYQQTIQAMRAALTL